MQRKSRGEKDKINTMLDFEPLMLKNKELFDSYVMGHGYNHSEASFSNMYVWQHAWEIDMAVEGNGLYVSMDSDVYRPFLLPPYLKDDSVSILPYMKICEAYMQDTYGTFYLKCATPEIVEKIKRDCGDRYAFSYDEYNSEYVYRTKDLIELTGKKYHSKRNHVNSFMRSYRYELVDYEPQYRDECLNLQDEWAREKQADMREAEEEYISIIKTLDHYRALHFKGCVVKVNGEVAAFSFGERISENTAIIHIEKAKAGIDGLYAFINREFVANYWSDCRYINRAEDMGVPGIRQAKRSYNPVFMLDKYDVVRKEE